MEPRPSTPIDQYSHLRKSPVPTNGRMKPKNRSQPLHHSRQVSRLSVILDQVDEENEEGIPADCVSTSASEASSKGSNNSEPALLDFIGNACLASAWFTSCFPCAVVDINDTDAKVMDKLSRESAMNVMYSTNDKPQEIEVPAGSLPENQEGPIHYEQEEEIIMYDQGIEVADEYPPLGEEDDDDASSVSEYANPQDDNVSDTSESDPHQKSKSNKKKAFMKQPKKMKFLGMVRKRSVPAEG